MDRALEQFLAVAEAGTIIGAAAALGMSQPALTYSMKKLEDTLRVSLFERSTRGVRLTSYGEILYENVLIMRRLYSNAVAAIARERTARDHGISIGTGYSAWSTIVRDLVIKRSKTYAGAPINVSIGSAMRCMDQLLSGDIVLFIGHKIVNLAREVNAEFIPLGLTRDGYFVRGGHPLLEAPRSKADVAAYPTTLAFPPEQRLTRLVSTDARDTVAPDNAGHAFTSSSLQACIEFALATDAALIHTDLMASEFARHGLSQVPMQAGEAPRLWPLGIYVVKERRRDARVQECIEEIVQKAESLGLPPCHAA